MTGDASRCDAAWLAVEVKAPSTASGSVIVSQSSRSGSASLKRSRIFILSLCGVAWPKFRFAARSEFPPRACRVPASDRCRETSDRIRGQRPASVSVAHRVNRLRSQRQPTGSTGTPSGTAAHDAGNHGRQSLRDRLRVDSQAARRFRRTQRQLRLGCGPPARAPVTPAPRPAARQTRSPDAGKSAVSRGPPVGRQLRGARGCARRQRAGANRRDRAGNSG